MSSLFTKYGMDFDSVFKSDTGKQYLGIYADNGLDIGQCYAAGSSPFGTGFYVEDGRDVKSVLLSDGTAWGTVRRTPGGWDAAENTGRGFDAPYLEKRAKVLRDIWWDLSKFVVVGSSDSMCSETGYYCNATKFFRIDQKAGAPEITGVRVQVNRSTNGKADVAPFYIENPAKGVFTFVLGYYRRSHGWATGAAIIYAQTAYGEAPIHQFNFSQP